MTNLFGGQDTAKVSISGNLVRESFTATAAQKIFTLTTFTYTQGVNALQVYIAGVKQVVGLSFTETSTSSITLTTGALVGQIVEIVGFPISSVQVTQYVPNAGSVTSSKLATASVSTNKIADSAVTLAKIDPNVYGASGANKLLQLTSDGKLPPLDASNLQKVAAATNQIQSIVGAVASNALTIALAPTSLDFRSSTTANGSVNARVISSAISLTVPSGATLGTVSAQASKIAVIAIDVSGTVELAVVNLAGNINLDESGLISTTAISASASSDSTIYSAAARTSIPYRLVGYVESTQATAGTWATPPSTVQGAGGYILSGISSLGYGQKWQNLTSTRALGTTYTNTTGKPILVSIASSRTGGGLGIILTIDSFNVYSDYKLAPVTRSFESTAVGIVPPGSTYSASIDGTGFANWFELR